MFVTVYEQMGSNLRRSKLEADISSLPLQLEDNNDDTIEGFCSTSLSFVTAWGAGPMVLFAIACHELY